MTRLMMTVAVVAVMLAGCGKPADPNAPSLAETRLAEKIIDAGGIFPLEEGWYQELGMEQAQGLFQKGMPRDQAIQAGLRISKNIELQKPVLKKAMVEALTAKFTVKELQYLLSLITSKESQSVQRGMPEVIEQVKATAEAVSVQAANRVAPQIEHAWPVKPPKPKADPAAPVAPGAPAQPQPPRPN